MAQTEAVVDEDCIHCLVHELRNERSLIARTTLDNNADRIVGIDELYDLLCIGFCQLYIKNANFATSGFHVEEIDNLHMGKIFVTRSSGDTFLTITCFPLQDIAVSAFLVSISYQSSFIQPSGVFLTPSPRLKSYYSKIKGIVASQAKIFDLTSNRRVWIKQSILNADPLASGVLKRCYKSV